MAVDQCSGGDVGLPHQDQPIPSATTLQPVQRQKAVVKSKAYGKGKVLERKDKGTAALAFPPTSAPSSIVLQPDTALRYPPWLEAGALGAHDMTSLSELKAAWQLIHSSAPALMHNLPLLGDLPTKLSVKRLEEMFEEGPDVDPLVCMGDENRFQECDAEKNIFGSFYHVREPRCKHMHMPFCDFSHHLRHWQKKRTMLKLHLREWRATKKDERDFSLQPSSSCPHNLQRLIDENVGWLWLEDLQQHHKMGAVFGAALEIGGRNALLPAQYLTQDRFIAQVRGTRRILVINPEHSFRGMYPFAVHHPLDSYSMVDWENPDKTGWPWCSSVRGRACQLRPGDVLFVPSCWWVIQQLQEPENLAMTFTLGMTSRVRQPPAQTLRVSRVVEELIGDLQGPGKVLYWLELLSKEAEEDVIDYMTTPGFLQIEAVWEARDVVDSVLGWRAWKSVFPAMCVGRLRETPWLNKDFKEPLYLTDKPRVVEDKRTEEQQKYPELFRHAQA